MCHRPATSLLFAGLLTGLGLLALPVADAGQPGTQPQAATFQAQALSTPQSRIEAETVLDDSIAGALVGAIVTSFDERNVQVRLDGVDLAPLDLEQSQASGHGMLKLGNAAEWIPFRFSALYDTVDNTASMPRLQIGGDTPVAIIDDGRVGPTLVSHLAERLQSEFPQQQPQVSLDALRMQSAADGVASIEATGHVDFGVDGRALAQVHALYDQRQQRLLRVDYQLQ